MKATGYIIATLAIIASPILNGWVLSKIWVWFVANKFGLPILSIPEAIGITIIAAMLTHQFRPAIQEDKRPLRERTIEAFSRAIFGPLITLGVASIVGNFL